jgi:SAM-dependent methyltransferase
VSHPSVENKFIEDFKKFYSGAQQTGTRFRLDWNERYPCLGDQTESTQFDRHYVYHTAWAARVLAKTKPARHVDISSSLYFCSIASAFIPIEFYDYRPPRLELSQLKVAHADLAQLFFESDSLESLSCMHVVEHIGLGRYGDPIDYDGDLKAIRELKRVLKKGGQLLFVVPVGQSRIEFNAHRIYSVADVRELFAGFTLKEFALIPDSADQGGLVLSASDLLCDQQRYACGCFWFEK